VDSSREKFLSEKILASVSPGSSPGSLVRAIRALFTAQVKSWPHVAAAYTSLNSIAVREIECAGYSVRLQFNPKRIVSTGAKVDAQSINERKCFLCIENLPPEQKGVLYKNDGNEFVVLVNPIPIFQQHFTISHVAHLPQAFEPNIGVFLSLAADLSPAFSVFYNGPRCGASAPDHAHFQASPSGTIPVENDANDPHRKKYLRNAGNVSCFTLENYGRQVVAFESSNKEELGKAMSMLLLKLQHIFPSNEEPLMNVLASVNNGVWRVIFFLRAKHRPHYYDLAGEAQVMISPALVDMGGLIVTPKERDFRRADASLVHEIFEEVSISRRAMEQVIASI